jgi:thiamine-monophosphate kinase
MSWSEDALHRWLAGLDWPRGLLGSRGHDAAVLHALEGRPVTCVDQCIEGVHFTAETERRSAGAKAVLRTLSDLAATAATPRAVTLAVRAPEHWTDGDIQGVILGAREAAVEHGAELVAGDLAMATGAAGLSVSALGFLEGSVEPVGRDRARPGQQVWITGPVGGSLGSGRHLRIAPRLTEGRALARAGATAMMDVSDGLALDLFRLARASSVAIELNAHAVVVHPDVEGGGGVSVGSAIFHALHDGEDHELVACLPGDAVGGLEGVPGQVVGSVTEGAGLWILFGGRRSQWTPGEGGWIHGGDGAT